MPRQYIAPKKLPYKKAIESIVDHSTDGKCGVRFLIKWKNFGITSKERSYFIMKFPNGKELLHQYLICLQNQNKRRFQFMMQREASLAKFLETMTFEEAIQKLQEDEDPPAA